MVRYFIMPNIINEVKLDFKDVLLRPKRSTLRSRADVSLYHERTYGQLRYYSPLTRIQIHLITTVLFAG